MSSFRESVNHCPLAQRKKLCWFPFLQYVIIPFTKEPMNAQTRHMWYHWKCFEVQFYCFLFYFVRQSRFTSCPVLIALVCFTCPWLASFPVFSLFLLSVPQFALCLFFVFHLRSCLEFPALDSVCVWFSIWVFCSSVVLGFPFCLFTLPPASFLIVFSLKLPFCSTVCPPGVCTWVFFLPRLKRKPEKLHFTLVFF